MKIGVFGDSFADKNNPTLQVLMPEIENESWIKCLEDDGHKVISYGLYGTSTYYSWEKFFEHFDQFDSIVFCYSSLERTPALPKGLESFSSLTCPEDLYSSLRFKSIQSIDLELALVRILTAKPHLYNPNFNLFLQQKIFNDVNLYCFENNIKLLNILSFETRERKLMNLQNRHGDVFYNLVEVSNLEMSDLRNADSRFNHLSKENNYVLSRKILRSLTNAENSKELVDMSMELDWIINSEITNRYVDRMEEMVSKVNDKLSWKNR